MSDDLATIFDKKITFHTLIQEIDGFYCKLTQRVSEFGQGHYYGYIEDKNDNVIAAFQSHGGVVPALRAEEATEIFKRSIKSYLEQI